MLLLERCVWCCCQWIGYCWDGVKVFIEKKKGKKMVTGDCDLVGDVIHNDDALGASVVGRSDGSEALLTCCVPLQRCQRGVM